MDTAKIYHDCNGNERTISQMVKYEPEWAANRIQAGEAENKKLQAELELHRWISVSERPPEKSCHVWMCYDRAKIVLEMTSYTYGGHYDIRYNKWQIFDPCGGFSDVDHRSPPTHWKPIILPQINPKPLKQAKGE